MSKKRHAGSEDQKNLIKKFGAGTLGFIGFGALSSMMIGCSPVKEEPKEMPVNFVIILSDDQGWNQVGYQGTDFYETPRIDQIAREGIYFTDAYSASPLCSPTRASIMTGKNPARLHLTDFLPGGLFPHKPLKAPAITPYLNINEKLLPEILQKHGYVTGHFGKWHLSPDRRFSEPGRFFDPQYRGFDDVLMNARPDHDAAYTWDAHHVEAITRRSLHFLENVQGSPFFLYVSHHVPHRPLLEEPELIKKYEAKPGSDLPINNPIMGAMIERMDTGIGEILDKIDELGLRDNTVIIFMSDNGGLELLQSQLPLRGGKAMVFEGGIRVPMCIRWPDVIQPGRVSSEPVITDDLLPTILDIAGISYKDPEIDGVSIVPLLTQETEKLDREALYWHYPHYHHLGYKPGGAVRMGDFKLIEWYEESLWAQARQISLYNLKDDMGETTDLSMDYPDLAVTLRRMLHQWRKETNAAEMIRNPHFDPEKEHVRLGAI